MKTQQKMETIRSSMAKFKLVSPNLNDFKQFLKQVFTNYDDNLHATKALEIFKVFDQDQDEKLDDLEIETMSNWIYKMFELRFALVLVDLQNDFIEGSLAIKNSLSLLPIVNKLINEIGFDKFVYTLDWHPNDHISFYDNFRQFEIKSLNNHSNKRSIKPFDKVTFKVADKEVEQILFPVHCVQNSMGAKLHKDLICNQDEKTIRIYKGQNKNCDSYSAFFDNMKSNQTELDKLLKRDQIDVLFVTGLATDYCVGETCKDALELGYSVVLVEDATKGLNEESIERTKLFLKSKSCVVINSDEVDKIVSYNEIRFEIGYSLAMKKLD